MDAWTDGTVADTWNDAFRRRYINGAIEDPASIVPLYSYIYLLPVLIAAKPTRKATAYSIDFLRSNRPGLRIQAVHGCTIKA
jgi:hypothetical protein